MTAVVYGLTNDGFIPKPMQVLRVDMQTRILSAFSTLQLGDDSFLGFFLGIIVEQLGLNWELLEAINSSQDPAKASGAGLDAVCAYTGTIRPSELPSTVTLTLFGEPGQTVPEGNRASTGSTGPEFGLDADATFVVVPVWASTTAYVVGNRVSSDTSRMYQCIVGGTSSSTPLAGTGVDITDGTVHWTLIQDDLTAFGVVDAAATCTVDGQTIAPAGSITHIVNGSAGWLAVTNLTDAIPGRDVATDEETRILRNQELTSDGRTVPDAIATALLKIRNVISVTVFTNDTDFVNADLMPPHTVEALVRTVWPAGDPQDQLIFDALLANVAAGITTTGNQSGSAADEEGNVHTIKFSRPSEVLVFVDVTLVKDPLSYPSDGDAQVKAAIAAYGLTQAAGFNVVATRVGAQVFKVSGVLDIPRSGSVGGTLIGIAALPTTDTTIPISTRQIAAYDSGRVTVHTSDDTP
jgi:uncharacterized phage protein gp47/JayE